MPAKRATLLDAIHATDAHAAVQCIHARSAAQQDLCSLALSDLLLYLLASFADRQESLPYGKASYFVRTAAMLTESWTG